MHDSYERRLRWLVRLTLIGTLFTAVVMLVGAWTRLVDAGLGCPDWPGCYGKLLVPDNEHATLRHPDVPLVPFKAWVEMVHRYIASLLGLLVISVVALGWSLRRRQGYPWHLSWVLLIVIVLQGAFGAFTVTLQLWPQVVTLHLLGGLSVLLLFLWLHLRLRLAVTEAKVTAPRSTNAWWVIAACLLVAQMALGGWVSSNYAGIACQGFPTCNGQWWPSMDISEGFHLTQTVGPNYLHGQLHADARTAIQVVHRLGALLLGLGLIALWWHHRRCLSVARPLLIVIGLYTLQAALGIANVVFWLPLWLALLHTAGAMVLATVLVWAWWRWRYQAEVVYSASVSPPYNPSIAQ